MALMRCAAGGDADVLNGRGGIDALSGEAGADLLIGGAGNDILSGGSGVDSLNGGLGIDLATYSGNASGVQVDLLASNAYNITSSGAVGVLQDKLNGIENVLGSSRADKLLGSNGSNILRGGAGADTLNGRRRERRPHR